jgi:catechol 2,3-dioxygenase-like lactoylglutathione lyase family enzyme
MHRSRVERIHHLTIAVPSLERALDLWRDALGVSPDIREFPDHQVREAAFPVGDLEIRLWQSTGAAGGDGDVLRQIGLQVTSLEEAVEACCTAGLGLVASGPPSRLPGRRRTLVDPATPGPALELVEAHPSVLNPPTVRPARLPARAAKRSLPAPRTRGAKPHLPPAAPKAVKTAKAPRPPVRPRVQARRGGKK